MSKFLLKETTVDYIASDYWRYTGSRASLLKMFRNTFCNHCFAYTFWLRIAIFEEGPIARLAKRMLAKLSIRHGIQIPAGTSIGYGLYIGHGIGIVVNPTARIGNNCNLSQFTTIGAGAVAVKDVPENATVAGVPAKVLSYKAPGRFIGRRWLQE